MFAATLVLVHRTICSPQTSLPYPTATNTSFMGESSYTVTNPFNSLELLVDLKASVILPPGTVMSNVSNLQVAGTLTPASLATCTVKNNGTPDGLRTYYGTTCIY